MPKFNEFQKAAIRAYPNDDFKYLLEENEPDTCDIGDGLIEFIIRELGDDDMDIKYGDSAHGNSASRCRSGAARFEGYVISATV